MSSFVRSYHRQNNNCISPNCPSHEFIRLIVKLCSSCSSPPIPVPNRRSCGDVESSSSLYEPLLSYCLSPTSSVSCAFNNSPPSFFLPQVRRRPAYLVACRYLFFGVSGRPCEALPSLLGMEKSATHKQTGPWRRLGLNQMLEFLSNSSDRAFSGKREQKQAGWLPYLLTGRC